jgi:hypothetical protein
VKKSQATMLAAWERRNSRQPGPDLRGAGPSPERTSSAKLRPRDLAAQDLELVAQDQQLDVLDVQTAATPNERSKQRPEREIEKREGHGR